MSTHTTCLEPEHPRQLRKYAVIVSPVNGDPLKVTACKVSVFREDEDSTTEPAALLEAIHELCGNRDLLESVHVVVGVSKHLVEVMKNDPIIGSRVVLDEA